MNLSFSPDDILTHAVAEHIDGDRVKQALEKGEKLRVKLGIDPTSPDIHLGRSIALWKLRAFQELGCDIHLIIGDVTGQVGDASDKESERPMLSEDEIAKNLASYEEQVWLVLNPAKKSLVHFHRNSEWLNKLTLKELALLADSFSVNSFVKRELITRRLEEGSRVSLREMLYPLMQGYDSVMVEADVELGGTDQRFNLLAGRTLQERAGQAPQALLMNPIVAGTDGRKMSSSWGNVIALLDTPVDKFGKLMSIADGLMAEYLWLLPRSACPFTQEELVERMEHENPRDLKLQLAWSLVALYHGEAEADRVKDGYIKQFSEGRLPEELPEVAASSITVSEEGLIDLMGLLVQTGLAPSRSEARRLVEGRGVRLEGEVQPDPFHLYAPSSLIGQVLQVGKRAHVRIV